MVGDGWLEMIEWRWHLSCVMCAPAPSCKSLVAQYVVVWCVTTNDVFYAETYRKGPFNILSKT
jgi:hypothetical protein